MNPTVPRQLKHIEVLARLMDSRFAIPGTSIRFGFDGLIGLIPGIGDFSGLLVSFYIVGILAQNGASGFVLSKMVFNILIDTLLGSIPIIGDLFDFAFKANQRNLELMREHYVEGRHRGGAWKLILPVLILLFLFMAGLIWLMYKLVSWIIHA